MPITISGSSPSAVIGAATKPPVVASSDEIDDMAKLIVSALLFYAICPDYIHTSTSLATSVGLAPSIFGV